MNAAAHETRLAVALQDDSGHWHAHGSAHYPDTMTGRFEARVYARGRRAEINTRGFTRAGCCGCPARNVSVVPVRYDEGACRYGPSAPWRRQDSTAARNGRRRLSACRPRCERVTTSTSAHNRATRAGENSLTIPLDGRGSWSHIHLMNAARRPVKSLLITVARAIIGGDVQSAREDAAAHRARHGAAVTPAEGRALIGACKEAHLRYGCRLDWREFAFG